MNEFQMREALRAMRNQIEVPPLDRAKEDALLAAFDAHLARPGRAGSGRLVWAAATAASLAIAAALNVIVARNVRQRAAAPTVDASNAVTSIDDASGFMAWPGASTLPPFESGALLQIDLPASALPVLGFAPSTGASVQAEVIVGQDGLARAIRLVQ